MTNEPTLADALLPCPFCGENHATTTYTRDGSLAVCTICGAKSGNYYHGPAHMPSADERAIAAWNSRAPADDKDATIARLTAERDAARSGNHRNNDHEPTWAELVDCWKITVEQAEAKLAVATAAGTFAQGIEAAAERIDREISNRQAQLSREGSALSDLKRPSVKYAIRRADLDARMSCRDAIRALAPQPEADPVREAAIPDYDAGLLNDFGGGDVDWWQDYLRAEIGRANDYWRSALTGGQQ